MLTKGVRAAQSHWRLLTVVVDGMVGKGREEGKGKGKVQLRLGAPS